MPEATALDCCARIPQSDDILKFAARHTGAQEPPDGRSPVPSSIVRAVLAIASGADLRRECERGVRAWCDNLGVKTFALTRSSFAPRCPGKCQTT